MDEKSYGVTGVVIFMNEPKYIFFNGKGDDAHEKRINERACKKYKVKAMIFDGEQLIVFMTDTH
jgi:hypothetical protein